MFRLRFDRGACHGPAASRRQERLVYRRSGDGSSSCPDRRSRPKPCRFRCGDIAAADFQSLAWRRALTKVLRTPGPRSLRYQAPCCSKTFPVTRGKLGAARGLWSRIMIAFSCPASEHVCWHNLCWSSGYRDFASSSRGWSDAARTHFKRAALLFPEGRNCPMHSRRKARPPLSGRCIRASEDAQLGKWLRPDLNCECPN